MIAAHLAETLALPISTAGEPKGRGGPVCGLVAPPMPAVVRVAALGGPPRCAPTESKHRAKPPRVRDVVMSQGVRTTARAGETGSPRVPDQDRARADAARRVANPGHGAMQRMLQAQPMAHPQAFPATTHHVGECRSKGHEGAEDFTIARVQKIDEA
jgi:hypothetical protein